MLNKTELLQAALFGYEEQQRKIEGKILDLQQTLQATKQPGEQPTHKHRMTKQGRKRLSVAMKRRWAVAKKAGA